MQLPGILNDINFAAKIPNIFFVKLYIRDYTEHIPTIISVNLCSLSYYTFCLSYPWNNFSDETAILKNFRDTICRARYLGTPLLTG